MPIDLELDTSKEASQSKPSGKKWTRVAIVLLLLLCGGSAAWFWLDSGPSPEAASANRVRSTLHLDTFVLNLADTDQRSYLRVGIDLGLRGQGKRGEPAAPTAQVRDTILGVLAQAKVDDLLTAAGKAKLKQDLLQALQERLPQLEVEEVYFTEFLIQR